ncbi:MAG: winged helix-turn-helix transcriptional regulator [bacterium]
MQTKSRKNLSQEKEEHIIFNLLDEIEKDPYTSQRKLSRQLGIALGMVNVFLKRVVSKGYVKFRQIDSRNVKYWLTSHGVVEKSRLTYRFFRSSYRFIRLYRLKVYEVLSPFAGRRNKRVILYGSGEEAELAYLTIHELGMKLEGIVDPDRVGMSCVGHEVRDHAWLLNLKFVNILLVLHSKQLQDDVRIFLKQLEGSSCEIQNLLKISL